MSDWHPVGQDTMLEDDQMTEVTVAGFPMLLVRVDRQYYATQALCPHLRGRLSRGRLDGHVVTCPSHGSRFDVRDGRNLEWTPGLPSLARRIAAAVSSPSDLRVYATRIADGQVWVSA